MLRIHCQRPWDGLQYMRCLCCWRSKRVCARWLDLLAKPKQRRQESTLALREKNWPSDLALWRGEATNRWSQITKMERCNFVYDLCFLRFAPKDYFLYSRKGPPWHWCGMGRNITWPNSAKHCRLNIENWKGIKYVSSLNIIYIYIYIDIFMYRILVQSLYVRIINLGILGYNIKNSYIPECVAKGSRL